MPDLVNPLAAFRDSYGLLEGMAQDRTRRTAGNALAQGDYGTAQGALYGRGMLEEGQAVGQMQQGQEDRQRASAAAQDAARQKQAAETLGLLGNVNEAMAQIPEDQRAQYFATQVVPQLQGLPGMTPEAIAEMTSPGYDWSDRGIATHRALLGDAERKLQVVPRGNGGYDVLDMSTGDPMRSVEPTQEPERIEGPDGIYERDPQSGQWKKVQGFGPAPRLFAPRGAGRGGSVKPPTGFIPDP